MADNPFDVFDEPGSAPASGPLPQVVSSADPDEQAQLRHVADMFDAAARMDRIREAGSALGREVEAHPLWTADDPSTIINADFGKPKQPSALNMGQFGRGVGIGLEMFGAGLQQYGLTATGQGLKAFGQRQQQNAPEQKTPSVFDIKGLGDLGTYIWENATSALGTSVPMIAGGFGGAAAGGPWGAFGGVQAGANIMGVGQMRNALEDERHALFGKAEAAKARGDVLAQQLFDREASVLNPDTRKEIVFAAGTVMGMLESVTPFGAFFRGMPVTLVNKLNSEMARVVVTHIAKRAAEGVAKEGTTEALQAVVEIVAVAKAKGLQSAIDYAKAVNDQRYRLIEEAAAGAAGGMGLGAVGAAKDIAVGADQRGGLAPPILDAAKATAGNPFDQFDRQPAPVAGGVEVPEGIQAPVAPSPERAAEVERAVETWKAAQTAQGAATEAAPVTDGAQAVIETLPPETASVASEALRQAEEASPGITEQVTQAVAPALQEAETIPAETQAELDRLGIANATSEDEVRKLVAEKLQREQPAPQDAGPSPEMERLQAYIAQGGQLSKAGMVKAAEAVGVAPDKLGPVLEEGVKSGLLRKKKNGQYRRAVKPEARQEAITRTVDSVIREMLPILPKGTVVKSFKDLADLPGIQGLRQDGGRVVDDASGRTVDAFAQDGQIYLAVYAVDAARGRLTHEALHVLVDKGLIAPSEVSLLAERARKTGKFTQADEAKYRAAYAGRENVDLLIAEEAAAALVEARANGETFGAKIDGILDRILNAIKALGNALRGKGFRTAQDVLDAFEAGDMARREAVQAWMRDNDITAMAVKPGALDDGRLRALMAQRSLFALREGGATPDRVAESLVSADAVSEGGFYRASGGQLMFALSPKAKRLKASGTAAQWIARNEHSVADWNPLLKEGLPAVAREAERRFQEAISPDGIAAATAVSLRGYLDLQAANPGAVNADVAAAMRQYRNDPDGATTQIEAAISRQRGDGLDQWRRYLTEVNADYAADPYWLSYVWDGVTSGLRKDWPDLPPPLNAAAVADVYAAIQADPHNRPFGAVYAEAAAAQSERAVSAENKVDATQGREWVKIPRTNATDPAFAERVAMIRNLSCATWCTSGAMADPYIQRGDFWMLRDGGATRLAIRFDGSEVAEIQGPSNDGRIPTLYAEDVRALVDADTITLNTKTKNHLRKAVARARAMREAEALAAAGRHVEAFAVLGIEAEDVAGGVRVASLGENFETEIPPVLFERIVTVGGDLTLREGASAPALTTVGGALTLREGASAPALTTVGGILVLYEGASAPALTTVGGDLTLREGASAPAVTTVGGALVLREGASAPAVTTVGGALVLYEGASAPALTTVGGNLILYEGASAPALTTVGGALALREGASATALTTVGGNLILYEGASAPALTTVGGDLVLREGASAPALTTVGGILVLYEGASAPAVTTVGGDLVLREGASAPPNLTTGHSKPKFWGLFALADQDAGTPEQMLAQLVKGGAKKAEIAAMAADIEAMPRARTRLWNIVQRLVLSDAAKVARARENGFDVDTKLYHGSGEQRRAYIASQHAGGGPGVVWLSTDRRLAEFYADNRAPDGKRGYVDELVIRPGRQLVVNARGEGPFSLGAAHFADDIRASADQASEAVRVALDGTPHADAARTALDGMDSVEALTEWRRDANYFGSDPEPYTSGDTLARVRAYHALPDTVRSMIDSVVKHPKRLTSSLFQWAKDAGYDSIRIDNMEDNVGRGIAGRQTQVVVFDPKNIRRTDAVFDPAKADSPNLMFAMRDEPASSLQSIVSDMARDLGLTIRQGLSRTAAGRSAKRAGIKGVFDPTTGIIRVASVADLDAVARASADAIRSRFGGKLDAIIAANADDLTLAPAPQGPAKPFAATGFSGLNLDADMQARVKAAAVSLARTTARNAASLGTARDNAQTQKMMHDLTRRLGASTATAVIRDVLGAQKAVSRVDILALMAMAENPQAFAEKEQIRARLDGMPYLPAPVRAHILQGKAVPEMLARAKAVALEALGPDIIRRSLAALDATATAVDVARVGTTLGLDASVTDAFATGGIAAVRSYLQALAAAADRIALSPGVVPPLYQYGGANVDAKAVEARIAERFSKDGTPTPAKATAPDQKAIDAGFRAWFRNYLISPTAAEAQAPYLFDDLEGAIDAADPVLAAKLDSTQDAIQAYFQADPARVVEAMIRDATRPTFWQNWQRETELFGVRGALTMRLSSLYTNAVDTTNPFTLAVREALELTEKNTGTKRDLLANENAAKLMRMAPHANAWATRDLEDGIRPRDSIDPRGPSLIDALVTALGKDRATARDVGPGSQYRKFGSFLVARYAAVEWARFRDGTKERAPTAQPPGTGSPDEAIAFYESVAASYEAANPSFAAAAEMVYDYQAELLKLQKDAGFISQQTFDELSPDRFYVPFYRAFDESEDVSNRALGTGPGGILKRKRGSERDVIDPIAGIAQKTFETRSTIALNDVKRQLLHVAEQAGPGGGVIAERVSASELKGMNIDMERLIESAARDAGVDARDKSQLMDLMQQVLGNDAVASYYTSRTIQPGREPITFFWENGEVGAMRLGDGSHGHQLAAQMFDALNTFGKAHVDHVMALAAIPAQAIRLGITTHPEFAAANLVRDALMAYQYDPKALPFLTQAKGIVDVLRGADYVKGYYRTGGMMGGEATSALDKLRIDRDVRGLIQRGYTFKTFDSLANMVDHFRELFEARNWKDRASGLIVGGVAGAAAAGPMGAIVGGLAGATAGGRALVKLGEVSETATRARLWKHAYDRSRAAGLDEVAAAQEAAFWAHDYTDYSRRGSKMDGLAAIIPFLNANMQGNDVYIRRLLGKGDQGYNPGLLYPAYRLGLLDITALSPKEQQELGLSAWTWAMTIFGLGSISAIISMMWDDDDRIKDIDEKVKSTHWLIPVGDTIYRVPKPFQTVWFSQLVERWITEGQKNNPRWFEHYMGDLWNTWKPPLMPAVAEIGATLLNYDASNGRPIVPQWAPKDVAHQFNAYTSEFAKWAAPKLGIAPYYVDHMLIKFGASWGRTFTSLNIPGTQWYNPAKPTKGPEEEFISRRFLWKVGRGSEAGKAVREMMGVENPLRMLTDVMAAPYTRYGSTASAYKARLDGEILAGNTTNRGRPDHAGAVADLEAMSDKERGFAILEGHFRKPAEHKFRLLHPMNRAEALAQETMKLEKEIVGGELLTGKKGKDQKQKPLDPSEKAAARDILTQYRMMEMHNALVLTEEPGWAGRSTFKVKDVLGELKAASPTTHKELMARFEKAGILSYSGVAVVWPKVKDKLESPLWIERVRKNRLAGTTGMFEAEYQRAKAARDNTAAVPQFVPAMARW